VLGEELRKARDSAGLTQEELAYRAKLSRNYISLLELDQKSPTFDTLTRICEALGIRLSVLAANVEGEADRQQRRRAR
jgi:transcriptional regulator with XRE-family HTH domain